MAQCRLPARYARWENFVTAIQRAIESCKTTGYEPEHHFRGVTKMVPLGVDKRLLPVANLMQFGTAYSTPLSASL